MKLSPLLAAALVVCLALPGPTDARGKKPKPAKKKTCKGKDGVRYEIGEGYVDTESCIEYTCSKKGKGAKMVQKKGTCGTTPVTQPPTSGFTMHATCDNNMKLFADGNLLATSNDWTQSTSAYIPGYTKSIEIQCEDEGVIGGILASTNYGFKTDKMWVCSSDGGVTWNAAYEIKKNSERWAHISSPISGISADAMWIWSGPDWNNDAKRTVSCKTDLGTAVTTTAIPSTTNSPPTTEKCPWSTPTSKGGMMQCGDGTFCNVKKGSKWGCCKKHDGRRKCPPSYYMCAAKTCVGNTQHCCEATCDRHGGPRPCEDLGAMERKIEALEESVQTILEKVMAIQSTSDKHELNITSNMDSIRNNKESIVINQEDISQNTNSISTNSDTCSDVKITANNLGTCLSDINSMDCPSSEKGKTSITDAIADNRENIQAQGSCCGGSAETTTPTIPPPQTVYIIAGGNYNRRGMELYHPSISNLQCSITPPSLKGDWKEHTTFYHNSTIYLCGGASSTSSICISYSRKTEGWNTHTLSISRYYGYTSAVIDNTLYIIGGVDIDRNEAPVMSTSVPLTSEPVFTPVSDLNYQGTYPCAVKINEDSFIVSGGNSGGILDTVTEYNTKTSTATSLSSLKRARYFHGCVMTEVNNKKWMIVAGGRNWNNGNYLLSTEILELGGNSWESMGDINVGRVGFSMISTGRGVMAIAGYDYVFSDYPIKSVELLDWTSKTWKLVEPSIQKVNYVFGGAVEIPASMFDCEVTLELTTSGKTQTAPTESRTTMPIESTSSGITQATSSGSGLFSAPVKACLKHFNNEEIDTGLTLEECKQRCLSATSFVCKSFDFSPPEFGSELQHCFLSEETKDTQPGAYTEPCYIESDTSFYIERIFNSNQMECRNGGDLLSTSPSKKMVLCNDIKNNTCEKNLEELCPAGWHLCSPKEFNNRNEDWTYPTPELTMGEMYCRLDGGTSPFEITQSLNKDDPGNCSHRWSSRPGCTLWENNGDCNNKEATALCCGPAATCGNGEVDTVEEECDDGNHDELDECLNSCTWRTPRNHGLDYC